METKTSYCGECKRKVVARKPSTNHVLHILICFLTGGLWLLVWLFVASSNGSKPWQCTLCSLPIATKATKDSANNRAKDVTMASIGIVLFLVFLVASVS